MLNETITQTQTYLPAISAHLQTNQEALMILGQTFLCLLLMGYGFWIGRLSSRLSKVQKRLIHRALQAYPESNDEIIQRKVKALLHKTADPGDDT